METTNARTPLGARKASARQQELKETRRLRQLSALDYIGDRLGRWHALHTSPEGALFEWRSASCRVLVLVTPGDTQEIEIEVERDDSVDRYSVSPGHAVPMSIMERIDRMLTPEAVE